MKRIQWLRTRRPGVRIPHGVPRRSKVRFAPAFFYVYYQRKIYSSAIKMPPSMLYYL